jgi:chitinase
VARVVTASFFNSIKSQAAPGCEGAGFYTRSVFLNAASSYPHFAHVGSEADGKREIAAFFAHATHETGCKLADGTHTGKCIVDMHLYHADPFCMCFVMRWGIDFCYIREVNGASTNYCVASAEAAWPCVPGQGYYGRGPLQLSYNFNYGPAGRNIGYDGLGNPDLVAQDPLVSFKSSLWFWMDNVHRLMPQGFGATIRAVNGGECNGGNTAEMESRVRFYLQYCGQLGVDPGGNLTC